MFICKKCDHHFEDGEEKRIIEDCCDYPVCPICGSEDFDEAKECAQCNRYALDVEDGLCPECADNLRKKFDDFYTDLSIAETIYYKKNSEYMM